MTDGLKHRLERMREAFDRSFGEPPRKRDQAGRRLLSVRTRGGLALLPLDRLTSVGACPELTPLPGAPDALLGLATVRGVLVAAHSLHRLLGGDTSLLDPHRHLALTKEDPTVALVFDEVERYLRVPAEALLPIERSAAAPHVRQMVRTEDTTYPLVDVDDLVSTLRSGHAILGEDTQ